MYHVQARLQTQRLVIISAGVKREREGVSLRDRVLAAGGSSVGREGEQVRSVDGRVSQRKT